MKDLISAEGSGEIFKHDKNTIFFGNECFEGRVSAQQRFFLHQVHSNKIVPASLKINQADGQFTDFKNQALFIKTADCMPVFISSPSRVIALHIGWRGLMEKIFSEAIKYLDSLKGIQVFIGPHIHFKYFQLNSDLCKKLLSPHQLSLKEALKLGLIDYSYDQKDHYYINLQELLSREINIFHLPITSSSINTYTSPVHYSHRRNPYRIGQNYSFIIKA